MSPSGKIRLVATGDIALNGGYNEMVCQGEPNPWVNQLASLLADADLAIGNLEGPLTMRPPAGPPWRYCLRGQPQYARLLRLGGFHVLSLANNHIMDCGWGAVEETIERLTDAGIQVVGVGKSLEEARQPLRLSVKGLRISILGYCGVSVAMPIYAAAKLPGVAPARRDYILEDIAAAKRDCDFLAVCMHWGQEHVGYPTPAQRRLAREMIYSGANLVIGHHPHTLQGVERIAGSLVAYSLGNFAFAEEDWAGTDREGNHFTMPYRLSESARRTALWKVEIADNAVISTHELIPAYLAADLRTTHDERSERTLELEERNAALRRPGYTLLWTAQMLRSRSRVLAEQLSFQSGLRAKLFRLRPRHLFSAVQMIKREWEQIRGVR